MHKNILFLPLTPVSTNNLHGLTTNNKGRPQKYPTAQAEKFRDDVEICIDCQDYKEEKLLGKVELDITFLFKDKKVHDKMDLDNLEKLLIDCIKGKVMEDDKFVKRKFSQKLVADEEIINDIPVSLYELKYDLIIIGLSNYKENKETFNLNWWKSAFNIWTVDKYESFVTNLQERYSLTMENLIYKPTKKKRTTKKKKKNNTTPRGRKGKPNNVILYDGNGDKIYIEVDLTNEESTTSEKEVEKEQPEKKKRKVEEQDKTAPSNLSWAAVQAIVIK